jgi:hypothetical protein
MSLRSKLLSTGVRIYNGTPEVPLSGPALFLRISRVAPTRKRSKPRIVSSLVLVRPGIEDYIVKELISDMELEPEAAVEKALDIARRGQVQAIYLNGDLERVPPPQLISKANDVA